MNISSRQRMILEILIRENTFLTVHEIAEKIQVSSRTVHRELHELEKFLEQFGIQVVKRSGVGVQIRGTDEEIDRLLSHLSSASMTELTSNERKAMILCLLLEAEEPVKLLSLAYDLKVATATISHDLDELEEWLNQNGLSLIRKRGYGVEITGPEFAKRRAISNLIVKHFDESELIGIIKQSIPNKSLPITNSVSERLLGLIEKEKLAKVEMALRDIEKELSFPLADSAYIALVVHLSLVIERIARGEKIEFDPYYLAQLKDKHEYKIAKHIIDRLGEFFGMEIPEAESGYITTHLMGAKLRQSTEELFDISDLQLKKKIQTLIRTCEKKLGRKFLDEQSLFHGLLTHMYPALHRMLQNMPIRNPLLEQIKKDYPELFHVIRDAVAEVFPTLHVPDEEIGFLVMHFGASLEREHRKLHKLRAYVVCSSGIGTSKMLASRIEKEIPDIEVVKNISLFDIGEIGRDRYDLIISTITLPIQEERVIVVSPLLSQNEIAKIKAYVQSLAKESVKTDRLTHRTIQEHPILALQTMQARINQIVEIIESITWVDLDNRGQDIPMALSQLCHQLATKGVLSNAEKVVQQLLEREKQGGLGIPNTSFGFYHGRSEYVSRSSFTICSLRTPFLIQSMDNKPIAIQHILLLLAPTAISKEGLEILSEMSSLLLEDETIESIVQGNQASVQAYFAKRLYDYCYVQMELERSK
jgi:mannitol operon transcriptional antiterminator